MLKNTPIMAINFDEGKYEILNEKLLPFEMQGKIKPPLPGKEFYTKYELVQANVAANKNYEAMLSFLSHRTLPISRENAKKIYELFGFEQAGDDVSKAKIALVCRALSLQDNYWIKIDGDNKKWEDVNLRENRLNEIVTQVALYGSSFSLTGEACNFTNTPEISTFGAYAKAWKREDGGLYLYKLGNFVHKKGEEPRIGSWESKIEVMVSNLLDACNVKHLKYDGVMIEHPKTKEKFYACKCKCMTTESVSILTGMDFISWCNRQSIDPYEKALEIDAEMIYKMAIVDYLTSNRDRHGQNWVFFYDCDTMEILGCHPLYDHNNAFDLEAMGDRNRTYLYDRRKTMEQAAKEAMQKVDFHFTREITRNDFLTDRQYKSFVERASILNVRVVEKSISNAKNAVEDDEEENFPEL